MCASRRPPGPCTPRLSARASRWALSLALHVHGSVFTPTSLVQMHVRGLTASACVLLSTEPPRLPPHAYLLDADTGRGGVYPGSEAGAPPRGRAEPPARPQRGAYASRCASVACEAEIGVGWTPHIASRRPAVTPLLASRVSCVSVCVRWPRGIREISRCTG